jgi:hypothetical protein
MRDGEEDAIGGRRGRAAAAGLQHQLADAQLAECLEGVAARRKDRHSAGANGSGKARLLARHALEAAQRLEMRRSDQGDDRDIGFDHRGERRHLARRRNAGFDNRIAMMAGIDPGERERHADLIVVVAARREDG